MSNIGRIAAGVALAAAGWAAQAQQGVSIITTPQGSYSHSAGAAIAKALVERGKIRAVVQPQASTGFDELDGGQVDLNVVNNFDATFYASSTGEYEGRGAKNGIRNLGVMIPYRVAIHVRNDSPIKTLAELKGKRMSSGYNAQKTIARIVEAHLASAGLGWKDVSPVPAPNVVRQAEDFMSGKVDGLFFALGAASVKQAAAQVGGLRVLPVNDSPDAMKRITTLLPGAYTLTVNPDPSLDGITAPTKIIAFDMILISNAKLSDQMAYDIVKTLHGGKAEMAGAFPPFNLFNAQNMAKAVEKVPFHPGAEKFYREVGLLR